MNIRKTNVDKDFEEIYRIWQEIGWIEKNETDKKALKIFLKSGKGIGAEINGNIEAFVNSNYGEMRYLKEDLPLHCVAGVTVSRIARKQGFASRLTAKSIAEAVQNGMVVSGLGMFDQGFYDKLGFGTGSYEHLVVFDPADLILDNIEPSVPTRITYKDWEKAHEARLNRKKYHGFCTIKTKNFTKGEMYWGKKKSFGLGYKDKEGNLTHYFWVKPEKAIHGPYFIRWMVFNNKKQFMELMALMKNLGDQVHAVKMSEPAGIQLQDLIKQPFKGKRITENSNFEQLYKAVAYWQMRIINLEKCLAHTHLPVNKSLKFNLKLEDPIENYLPQDSDWKGLSGEYMITLGSNSDVKEGRDASLPTLKSSVGAFTRMWLGVLPATRLAYTDNLSAPETLLEKLDNTLMLPQPKIDWDF